MTSQVDQVGLLDEHGDHHICHISLIARRVLQVKTYFFVNKKSLLLLKSVLWTFMPYSRSVSGCACLVFALNVLTTWNRLVCAHKWLQNVQHFIFCGVNQSHLSIMIMRINPWSLLSKQFSGSSWDRSDPLFDGLSRSVLPKSGKNLKTFSIVSPQTLRLYILGKNLKTSSFIIVPKH